MRSTSATCPDAARARHDRGFTLVTVVFVLVVLALLGTGLARVSLRQQLGSAAEIEQARAMQGARAGLEWAAFQVLRNPAPPAAAPACFGASSFAPAGLSGFMVTVDCTRTDGSDGGVALAFYRLVATACNAPSGGACPTKGTPGQTYVERRLTWTLTR